MPVHMMAALSRAAGAWGTQKSLKFRDIGRNVVFVSNYSHNSHDRNLELAVENICRILGISFAEETVSEVHQKRGAL